MSTIAPTVRLALRDDVAVMGVDAIDPAQRAQLDCAPDDAVLSQFDGRASSLLLDAETADLLRAFAEPRTVAEAVVAYCEGRDTDPETVLDDALPLVHRLFARRFLVDAEAEASTDQAPRLVAGDRVDDLLVVRVLQELDDCAVYQVRQGGRWAALKLYRPADVETGSVGSCANEAELLTQLGGAGAPTLLRRGSLGEGSFLLLGWCTGTDLGRLADDWQQRVIPPLCTDVLRVCRAVVHAYAGLHGRGVLHGDVHPRNVLIDEAGQATVVDFAAACRDDEAARTAHLAQVGRPGVPFYIEPEHARALRDGEPPVPLSPAGEQFAVGALLYRLLTGTHYADFGLERASLHRDIVRVPPVPLTSRGLLAWPALESVLFRALAKDPAERHPSMRALAAALDAIEEPEQAHRLRPSPAVATRADASDRLLRDAGLNGPWLAEGLPIGPTASVVGGAAGVALALLRVASQRDDAAALALADLWARRAETSIGPDGFYNADLGLPEAEIGTVSPFHTASGVHAVRAMVARARNDRWSFADAVERFLADSAGEGAVGDLTLGHTGTLLVAARLAARWPPPSDTRLDRVALDGGARDVRDRLWQMLDRRPEIASDRGDLGMAHGWAGDLYATLTWSRASGDPLPAGFASRLDELAALAVPVGRGVSWLRPGHPGSAGLSASWCQGTAGMVFLWSDAARFLRDARFVDLAEAAGRHAWESTELASHLCCGLAGRAWAMLCLFRLTDDATWRTRARELAARAAREARFEFEQPYSLYKGPLALAVLAADLERPATSAMPFFEDEGWSAVS